MDNKQTMRQKVGFARNDANSTTQPSFLQSLNMLTCISWTIRLYVFLYIVYAGQCSLQRNDNADALTSFFEEMDGNRDGRLDEIEAKKYFSESIGGQEFSSSVALSNAFRRMVENIDKETEDKDIISVSEVQQHIQHLQHVMPFCLASKHLFRRLFR